MKIPVFLRSLLVKSKLINFGISLVTILILTVIGEVVVRYVFSDVTTTSDGRGYFAKRWYEKHRPRENSAGFREREFTREKPVDVYRIAVIGDSMTYGQGLQEDDRFTNLLQQRIEGRYVTYEVLNFARSGAETVDHLKILKEVVLPASPNFVLLQWFTNDPESHDKSGRPRPWPLLYPRRLRSNLLGRSALLFLVNERWVSIQEQFGLIKTYAEYMRDRFADPYSPASLAAQEALEQLIAACKQRGVPLGMILLANPFGGGGPLDFLLERVLLLCEREGLTCIDTRSTFAAYRSDDRRLWVNRLDAHPGPLAHRLIAAQLIEVFGDTWLNH